MTDQTVSDATCLHCGRTSDDVPLVPVHFKGEVLWICNEHLPILIHHAHKLAEKLPGIAKGE
jgi:hypothetical protein